MGGFKPNTGAGAAVGELIAVPDVAALRAAPGGLNRVIVLDEPGRYGLFYWDIGADVDNDGTVFNPGGVGTTTAGWRRIYSGPLDVRWFGAIGDGVTDDAAAIQRAIDASPAGKTIYFPKVDALNVGFYKCMAALVPRNNTRFIGDGQANVSGATVPATAIIDGRNNPATPFLNFLGDVLGVPQDRGCVFEQLVLSFPSANKTDYSIYIGTTGLTFRNCKFVWAFNTLTGAPLGNPATDPGGIRCTSFEQLVFENCTFHAGTTQFSFLGSGAGGPASWRNCVFYDCNGPWFDFDSNGDHDYTWEDCMFDPLYRTFVPVVGLYIKVNGFSVRNCSFFGNPAPQPSGAYVVCTGTGIIDGCQMNATGTPAHPRGIVLDGCNLSVLNCKITAYCAIECPGGGSVLITRNNKITALAVPDVAASLPEFQVKRGIIVNYTVTGACSIDCGPDSFESVYGSTWNVVSTTGIGVSPIVIESDTADVLLTGDTVQIFSVTGNTAANGYWSVVKVDATHYQLVGSTGNGAYTGGGQGRAYYHFTNSYYVGGDDGGPSYTYFTSGIIHWVRNADQSGYVNLNAAEGALGTLISGNPKVGGLVRLDMLDPIKIPKGTGQTMRHADASGNLITNESFVSDVAYNLPEIECGLQFDFEKGPDVVTAGNPTVKMTITALPTTVAIVEASNTTPIVIETDTNHPFGTGDEITIINNVAAVGIWIITRIDATHFSLDGSVAAGLELGGTAERAAPIMLEGLKGGTTSIANSDTTQYNARISIEAKFRYNTSTGRDEIHWYAKDVVGDWLDEGAA